MAGSQFVQYTRYRQFLGGASCTVICRNTSQRKGMKRKLLIYCGSGFSSFLVFCFVFCPRYFHLFELSNWYQWPAVGINRQVKSSRNLLASCQLWSFKQFNTVFLSDIYRYFQLMRVSLKRKNWIEIFCHSVKNDWTKQEQKSTFCLQEPLQFPHSRYIMVQFSRTLIFFNTSNNPI